MALAAVAGVLGWDCDAGEGRMCIGSGLFLGLAAALGSTFMEIGCRIGFWVPCTVSFPLPSSVING